MVKGVVTGIKKYGAFIKVDRYEGLVHISEFSDGFVKDINDIVHVGDIANFKVIEVVDDKKLKLSYKAANNEITKMLNIQKGFKPLEKINQWIKKDYERLIK